MAQKNETLTLTSAEWTLVELDPDADGYIKVTIEQLNTNYKSTEYSPINTVTSPTARLDKWKQHFITDIYVKNVNASPTSPILLSIIREDKYEKVEAHQLDGYGNPIGSTDGTLNVGNFLLLVAQGKVSGHSIINKFGRNPSVGTSAFDAIWNGGGVYTGFNATVAETVTVVSSSTLDASTETGLRTIRLYGLDSNFSEITEDIVLNGTTPVTSVNQYLRCDNAVGLTAGSLMENQGTITIRQSITTANVFAALPVGYNTTMIAAYTIPAGKTGYILSQAATIANKNAAAVSVRLKIRAPGSIFTVNGETALNSTGTGWIEKKFNIPPRIEEKTDLFIEATASATVAVTAFIDILLIDN